MNNDITQYTEIFKVVKNEIILVENISYFSYFCSKHRLWVHVRTASPSVGINETSLPDYDVRLVQLALQIILSSFISICLTDCI